MTVYIASSGANAHERRSPCSVSTILPSCSSCKAAGKAPQLGKIVETEHGDLLSWAFAPEEAMYTVIGGARAQLGHDSGSAEAQGIAGLGVPARRVTHQVDLDDVGTRLGQRALEGIAAQRAGEQRFVAALTREVEVSRGIGRL